MVRSAVQCSSAQEGAELVDHVLNETNLLVQRHQDVFARNWHETAKNYLEKRLLLYAEVAGTVEGKKYCYPFIVCERGVSLVGHVDDALRRSRRTDRIDVQPGTEARNNFNESLPVLVGVSNLVDGPQGVVPSGVWFLGFDNPPLIGRKFLFYSTFAEHAPVWERIWLPCAAVDAPEGVPYARSAPSVLLNNVDYGFVERDAEPLSNVNRVPGDVLWKAAILACEHVRNTVFSFDAYAIGPTIDEPVDSAFKIVKLSLSSFDVFV